MVGLRTIWQGGRAKDGAFPARVGRRLGVAMGLALFSVLLVGGISVFLSISISRVAKVIKAESDEIEHVNRLHTMTHHVVAAVQNAIVLGRAPAEDDIELMLENLSREVAEYQAAEVARENTFEKATELEILQEIVGVTGGLADHSRRLTKAVTVGRKVDLRASSHLDKLLRSSYEKFERMNQIHQAKMKRSMQASEAKMNRIMGIYVAFAFLGGLFLVLGRVIFSRTIVLPVQRLAAATLAVAAGDFGKRVGVTSRDEIGQLSHSFNVMAERLEQHESELQVVQEDLARKVRETEALYRLGMEVSALLELDSILASVIEKARELLEGEAACLCLQDAEGRLSPRATSGPIGLTGQNRGAVRSPAVIGALVGRRPEGEYVRCEQYCAPIHEDPRLTHIAAPLKTGGKSIGTLCVSARSPRSFSSRETDLLQGLASQAAIAIENARLHQQLRSLTLLEERERIAMELHDGIIQSIYAVGLNLERCAELVKENPREVRGRLEGAIDELNEVIKEIRNYIFNLRPASPGGKGLKEILIEASKVVDNNPSVQVEVIAEEIREGLSEEQVTQLGQIAKEALANVLKHARASSATLRVSSKDHGLALSILDNGVGFNPQVVEAAAGQGLRNMAERARVLGADFFIDSSQGSGTEIRVEIPLASERGGPGHGRKLDTSSHR